MTKFNPGDESDIISYLRVANYKREWFNETVWVDFEGYKMPVPGGYDEILRAQYGDYMQLPREEQRVPATENLVYYNMDRSYLEFKGKYYCVK